MIGYNLSEHNFVILKVDTRSSSINGRFMSNKNIIENKLTYFVGTFILAFAFLFPAMVFAATITVPDDEMMVADAIAASSAGDTILLTANIVATEQITINKAITLDGGGFTIDAAFVKTSNSNNSALGVQSDNVLVKNLHVTSSADQPWPLQLHGINVYESTGVILEDVTASDFEGSGIVINSSEVTASNITTFNNGWHAINVDQRTSSPAILTINNTSVHGEVSPVLHIFVDDTTKDVTVTDVDNQYYFEDFDNSRVYTLIPFVRSLEIIQPTTEYEVVSGMVDFEALYVDEDGDDSVAWAVRAGTCAPDNSANVAGNVGDFSTEYGWTEGLFTAAIDMSSMDEGDYCFIINPRDDSDEEDLRATRWFTLENPDTEAPIVTIESPAYGDVVAGTVDVVGSVSDDNLSHYNVSLYPEGADVNDFSLRLDGETVYGSEVTNSTLWSFDSTLREDGIYQIRLAARDLEGNRDLFTPETGGDDSVHVIEIIIDNIPNDPQDQNECKKGGWEDFGFKNQGQCVRFVETEKDSR